MIGFLILMIVIQVVCIGFALYCLIVIKKKDLLATSKFLKRFLNVLFILMIIWLAFYTINSIIDYKNSFLLVVVITETVINLFFIIMMINYGQKFVRNLEKNQIFIKENATYLLEMSKTCIYYSIINGVAGITLAIISNIIDHYNFDYTISVSLSFFLFLLLGVVFFIIHLLFDRSIEMYEENKLTI